MDLALNNQQWLICHKTKLSQNMVQSAGAAKYTDYILAEG